jgi:hypothetical protein
MNMRRRHVGQLHDNCYGYLGGVTDYGREERILAADGKKSVQMSAGKLANKEGAQVLSP